MPVKDAVVQMHICLRMIVGFDQRGRPEIILQALF